MSRSLRHNPITGIAVADSEKYDKRKANRILRARVRVALARKDDPVLPVLREVSDVWAFAKDGKKYWSDAPAKWLRK
jgi:hypothetical protein